MNPLPLVFVGVGICVSSAHAEYCIDIPDGASGTPSHWQACQEESTSQAGPYDSVIIEKIVTLEEKIDAVFADPENFEDGEIPPTQAAVTLKAILSEASAIAGAGIPDGDVSPYFGELSVTWRRGNKMLRLTGFSNGRRARLDFGTTPERSLGVYQFNPAANGESLVDKLNWLTADYVAKASATS